MLRHWRWMSKGGGRSVVVGRIAAAPRRRRVATSFGTGRIAVRQLRSRAALTIAHGLTLAAAATLVASVVLIQSAATDSGLRSALVAAGQGADVIIERDAIATAPQFDAFQSGAAQRVRRDLGSTVIAGAAPAKSAIQTLRSIDGVQQGYPFSNLSSLSYYPGLRDHVRLVSGQWPADARIGSDWQLTASARATDTLGTPLDLRVGSEYCFNPRLFNGNSSHTWCGRIAATWLPRDVSDPYWAGQVPETDVLTGHDSFFQVLAGFPGTVNSALQQYVPDPAQVNAADTGRIASGVSDLRGFYGVSSNDVFVSGLDTTVSAFLARQSAAAGPALVTVLGLLAVAVAALGFAALHFMRGHTEVTALWRARGWPRLRVWALHTTEFGVLAVLAVPVAVLAAAVVSSSAVGQDGRRTGFGWHSLAAAAAPAAVACAAFLVILSALAAVQSGPELTAQRRPEGSAMRARGWRRPVIDVVLAGAGAAVLIAVRVNPASAASSGGLVLALPILAVALLAFASLRLVGVVARLLTLSRSVSGRLARWHVERDPAQYARLCLLLTLAVAVGVFASTYTASDRASAIDRADYMVGADVRATFSSASSPPQLGAASASMPAGVRAAQVYRGAGRPGRSGTDSTILGIQGDDFWNIAFARNDFATQSLASLTAAMTAADPDGLLVAGAPRALSLSIDSSGFDGRVDLEVTDAGGRDVMVPLTTLGIRGWATATAALPAASRSFVYPVRVRDIRIVPTGVRAVGDVAVQDLHTAAGTVIESFARADGWWQESVAPDPAEAPLTPSGLHAHDGAPSVDVPVDLQPVLLIPPPSARPLPVLLASQTMAALGVRIGQSFPLHIDTVDVELVPVGSFDEFPTYYPAREDLIVAPMLSLVARLGHQQSTSPWPNELWLTVPAASEQRVSTLISADPTLLDTSSRRYAESVALADPLRVGLHEVLGVGFVVALVVTVIGFGLHFLAAARGRVKHFAIMRANGIPHSVLRGSLVAEQVVVLISGLLAGTAIGLMLAWAIVPAFTLGTAPEDLTPPTVFSLDPLTLVAVVLGTGVLALLIGRVVAGSGSRVDVMSTVRSLT